MLRLYPDARPWSASPDTIHLGVADMAAALHTLRCLWSDHRDIASLPSLEVIAEDGVTQHQRIAVEDRLAGLIFDLGNSSEDAWWGARNAIRNSVACVNAPKQDALIGYAAGRPVVCVASGPSTTHYLDAIAGAQACGAVIVCADSIYRSLVARGIAPDVVCVLERQAIFAPLVPPDICPTTLLVCPPVVDPSTVAGWKDRVVWFWQSVAGLYDWIDPDVPTAYSGRSAGTLAMSVSRLMGGTAVHLVGHDLCRVGAESHAATVGAMTRDGQAKAEAEAPPCGMFARQDVACRDGEVRSSTRFWSLCRQDIEAMIVGATVPVYAVGMAGALIAGSIPRDTLTMGGVTDPPADKPLHRWPGRYRAHLIRDMRSDCLRAMKRVNEAVAATPQEALAIMPTLEPTAWAHADTAKLFAHVLGPIYNAATLRAHLRRDNPQWPLLALRVLQRGLPAMLTRIDCDLREMLPC